MSVGTWDEVAELPRHVRNEHPASEHQRRVRVPSVVDADVPHASLIEQGTPDAVSEPSVIEGLVGVRVRWEGPQRPPTAGYSGFCLSDRVKFPQSCREGSWKVHSA